MISGSELNSLEIGKIGWIFCHILGLRRAIPRLGASAESRALPQGTFVIWRDEKRVKLFSFFKYDVVSVDVVSPRKWDFFTNSGRVPTEEKTRRNEENTPKRRFSEVGHESFFLRKFRFSCPFGVKKAAIPRPGNVSTRGVHGVAYELLSRIRIRILNGRFQGLCSWAAFASVAFLSR